MEYVNFRFSMLLVKPSEHFPETLNRVKTSAFYLTRVICGIDTPFSSGKRFTRTTLNDSFF